MTTVPDPMALMAFACECFGLGLAVGMALVKRS